MISKWIDKMFNHSFQKKWFETYWAFDVHGVILKPNYRRGNKEAVFYPYAKEVMQKLSARKDIILIMFTSSYPEEINHYNKVFKQNEIYFNYINENPEIDSEKGNFGYYKDKFYFNVLVEDKAGFNPETDWKSILDLLNYYEENDIFPNQNWTTKY